jgi:hypothetical protein
LNFILLVVEERVLKNEFQLKDTAISTDCSHMSPETDETRLLWGELPPIPGEGSRPIEKRPVSVNTIGWQI